MGSPSAETNRLAQDIYNQIKNNFDTLVGTFKVLPLRIYLERPPHDGIELGTFRFRPWNQIRANGLIKMAIRQDNQNLRLQFRFYDVDAAQLAVRVDLSIAPKNYRWIIHQLCDRIYQYLTRNKGIFTSKIAYVQRNPSGKGKDIWIADFDGSQRKLVVRNGHLNLMPSWSPDGNSLVFMSFMDGQAYLYRLHLPSARIQRLTFQSGTYSGPVFSTDGKSIAFSMTDEKSRTDSNIYIMQANGSNMRKLTSSWGIDVSPTWSVDSSMLAFVSERFASPQIFVMNANGSNQTRLTFKGDYNQEPRWSPKHNEILFTARDEFLRYDLFVIRIDTNKAGQINTEYRRLTQNQGTNLEATWSPDGRFILFVSTRYGERKLFIMNADGSHQRLFMRGRGDFETPAWSPLLSKDISLRTASKPEPTTSPVTKPSVESDKPKADGDKPKADGDKPKADGDKPKADGDSTK
jgi:TolB protein